MASEPVRNGLDQIDTERLAKTIQKHATESKNEEDVKIRVETTLHPILKKWGIEWGSYENRHHISGGREDALYGHVIIEYKSPGRLDSKTEFKKTKEQVREYIRRQAIDKQNYSKYFGVILDGHKISFLRFSKGHLHVVFVCIYYHEYPIVRPGWGSHPFPFLDHFWISVMDDFTKFGKHIAAPIC